MPTAPALGPDTLIPSLLPDPALTEGVKVQCLCWPPSPWLNGEGGSPGLRARSPAARGEEAEAAVKEEHLGRSWPTCLYSQVLLEGGAHPGASRESLKVAHATEVTGRSSWRGLRGLLGSPSPWARAPPHPSLLGASPAGTEPKWKVYSLGLQMGVEPGGRLSRPFPQEED